MRLPAVVDDVDDVCPQCGGNRARDIVEGFIELTCDTCEYTLTLVARTA